jgi:hypothetical protein
MQLQGMSPSNYPCIFDKIMLDDLNTEYLSPHQITCFMCVDGASYGAIDHEAYQRVAVRNS